jgi:hypothetical protein
MSNSIRNLGEANLESVTRRDIVLLVVVVVVVVFLSLL